MGQPGNPKARPTTVTVVAADTTNSSPLESGGAGGEGPSLHTRAGVRNEVVAFVSEFCGTFMFLFMAFTSLQTAQNRGAADPLNQDSKPDISTLMYVATAFGLSLMVNCWLFYRVSGGMFNPAVSLGLALAGAITPTRLPLVVLAQLLASLATSWLLSALLPGPLSVSTSVAPGVSQVQALFLETFLTAQLTLTILLLAVEKHKSTFMAPLGIGIALFVGHLGGVYFTGAGLNPARSFGPATVSGFEKEHWVYWLGPCLGSVLAVGVWRLLRVLKYQTANPGQDFDDIEIDGFRPPKHATVEDVRRPSLARAFTGQSAARSEGVGSKV